MSVTITSVTGGEQKPILYIRQYSCNIMLHHCGMILVKLLYSVTCE